MARRYKVLGIVLSLLALSVAALAAVLSHASPCGIAQAVATNGPTMKAVVHRCYGPPDVIKLETVAKPTLAENGILIKVRAASVNPLDWHMLRGDPYIMRMDLGVGTPKDIRLGTDFAGVIEAVGRKVTRFKAGDPVFGGTSGAFAEYVSVREDAAIALKPPNITFEQAAAVPVAAITALQGLRDEGKVQPGQQVLINGASGGVGTFAVQIAKILGASVTGVTSTRNVELVRSLGADRVVDYTRQDFTGLSQRYDMILDLVGNRSFLDTRRVMKPHGVYIGIGGGGPNDGGLIGPLGGALRIQMLSPLVSQKLDFFVADLRQEDLSYLAGLIQAGKLTPIIDKRYKFGDIAEAIRYLERGHARGKVVVTLE